MAATLADAEGYHASRANILARQVAEYKAAIESGDLSAEILQQGISLAYSRACVTLSVCVCVGGIS